MHEARACSLNTAVAVMSGLGFGVWSVLNKPLHAWSSRTAVTGGSTLCLRAVLSSVCQSLCRVLLGRRPTRTRPRALRCTWSCWSLQTCGPGCAHSCPLTFYSVSKGVRSTQSTSWVCVKHQLLINWSTVSGSSSMSLPHPCIPLACRAACILRTPYNWACDLRGLELADCAAIYLVIFDSPGCR